MEICVNGTKVTLKLTANLYKKTICNTKTGKEKEKLVCEAQCFQQCDKTFPEEFFIVNMKSCQDYMLHLKMIYEWKKDVRTKANDEGYDSVEFVPKFYYEETTMTIEK